MRAEAHVTWYYPNTFECHLHQVSGGEFPFPQFCETCLEERLQREFTELTPELSQEERDQLYPEAKLMAIYYSRPALWFVPLPIAEGREVQRAFLDGDGYDLVDALSCTILEVAPIRRG